MLVRFVGYDRFEQVSRLQQQLEEANTLLGRDSSDDLGLHSDRSGQKSDEQSQEHDEQDGRQISSVDDGSQGPSNATGDGPETSSDILASTYSEACGELKSLEGPKAARDQRKEEDDWRHIRAPEAKTVLEEEVHDTQNEIEDLGVEKEELEQRVGELQAMDLRFAGAVRALKVQRHNLVMENLSLNACMQRAPNPPHPSVYDIEEHFRSVEAAEHVMMRYFPDSDVTELHDMIYLFDDTLGRYFRTTDNASAALRVLKQENDKLKQEADEIVLSGLYLTMHCETLLAERLNDPELRKTNTEQTAERAKRLIEELRRRRLKRPDAPTRIPVSGKRIRSGC